MESEGAKKNLNIEKITCPNEVLSNVYCQSKMKFYIFMVITLQNILMEHVPY